MSKRKEFSQAVRTERLKYAEFRCEWVDGEGKRCNANLLRKPWHCDHNDPDAMTGQPTFENARALCLPHHLEKTKQDIANIAKMKRREGRDLGTKLPTKQPIPTRMAPPKPDKETKRAKFDFDLPRKSLYQDVR